MSSSVVLQTGQVLLQRGRWGSALTGGGGEYQKAPPPQVLLQPTELFLGSGWDMGSSAAREGPSGQSGPWADPTRQGWPPCSGSLTHSPSGVPLVGGGLAQFTLKWTGSHMTLGQSSNPAMARLQTWPRCATEAMPSIVPPQWSFLWRHPWLFVSPWPSPVLSCPRPRLLPLWVLGRCSHRKRQP